ncbi:hypothetical protein LZG00_19650 [Rhodobacteraceae bacterium LMO-12]|nr:hypothetical protein [Rhodobacteraceae bacterium LMO-JJ12]
MKLKLTVLALLFAPTLALACPAHEQQAMSCAEGSAYDAATGTCQPQANS